MNGITTPAFQPDSTAGSQGQSGPRLAVSRAVVIFVALLSLIAGLHTSASAQSTWMDSTWTYRNQVAVTNPSGSALADFQVHLVIDSSFDFTKVNAGGADVRIAAADGITPLPFWIEQWDEINRSASIWVRVPSVPASGTTLYIYYGNSAATSISDGNQTFDFFDDFEGTSSTVAGYFKLGNPQTVMLRDQDWETAPPHTLSVVQANSSGYTYWGYYGLVDCGGIGVAFSNDLVNWTKSPDPIFTNARWPSVQLINGRYYMMYTFNYCTTPQIMLAESSDGINFTTVKTIVEPQTGFLNQNPNLFFNPADGKYYLYWFRGDGSNLWETRARSAATIEGLDDTSSEVLLLSSNKVLAAPNMLYYNGTYFLSTEVYDSNTIWNVKVYSGQSANGPFTPLPGNPVLDNGAACMFQHVFGNTLHVYYCKDTNGFWTLEHRSSSLSSRAQFLAPDTAKWSSSGGTWLITNDSQQDDSLGRVVQGSTLDRQILSSSFNGSDYVVEAFGKQTSGSVWGLGARVKDPNDLYSINLYDNANSSSNLFVYSWLNDSGPLATAQLGAAQVGQINANTWYKLSVKVHGGAIDVYKDGLLQIHTADSSLANGGVALYGENGTVAEFDDVLVRKYASEDPIGTLSSQTGAVLSSLTLNPNTVAGGYSSTGTVVLAAAAPVGGGVITLSSSNAALASVPATVTIPAGAVSVSFAIPTGNVTQPNVATITAGYQGVIQAADLTITPLLYGLTITPSLVLSGNVATGTVMLASPGPSGGISVSLSSSNPGVAPVPSTVYIPSGQTNAAFTITTGNTTSLTTATVTATYHGISQSAALSVTPLLNSLSFSPDTIVSGASSVGTVTLASPAPAGGIVISLASTSPAILPVPTNITVAGGATSATFGVTAGNVSSTAIVTVSASYGGATQTGSLTVASSGGTWLDSGWAYRSTVNITNPGALTLTNFELHIALDSSFDFSKVRSDGADLRFTDADGSNPIPFWIESWNPAQQSASIWMRVPTIPAIGATAYMYYGSPDAATSMADGNATFEFFDDFASPTLNAAKWRPSGGAWSITNDTQPSGSIGGVALANLQGTQILSSAFVGSDYVVQANVKPVTGRVVGLGVRVVDPADLYSINLYDDLNYTNNLYVYGWQTNAWTSTLGSAAVGAVNLNSWYKLTAKVHGSSIDVYKDDVLQVQASSSTLPTGGIALYGESGTVGEFDNVFVRQFAATEPSASVSTLQQPLFYFTLTPPIIEGGGNSQGTITLLNPAPSGGLAISLVSSNDSLIAVPTNLTIPVGATRGTFVVTSSAVSNMTSVSVSALSGGTTQSASLTLIPPLQSLGLITSYPASVIGSTQSLGAVTLMGPAPAGGALVSLSSSNASVVQVPATVLVTANSQTATFAIATTPVSTATTVTISAFYNGVTQTTILIVNPPSVTSVLLNPSEVVGGGTSEGGITLGGPAPAGGAVVALASSDPSVQVPANVTVPASVTSSTFSVTTTAVGTARSVTISATYASSTQTTTLTVDPPSVSSLSLNPTSVVGATTSTATVTLSAPAPIGGLAMNLSSSDPSSAQVPANVMVPAGATTATFTVTTTAVPVYANVTISASHGGTSQSALLIVTPAPVLVSFVSLNPDTVQGGISSVGTVTLAAPAPIGGAVVSLSSSNVSAATLPATVTVPANSTSASFTVSTIATNTSTSVTISATLENVVRSSVLTVLPSSGVSSLALTPAAVVGGANSIGTVTLNTPAPVGGAVINLSSNNSSIVQVPQSVTVAANATTATFAVTTTALASSSTIAVSATYNGTVSASLTVNPASLVSMSLNPSTVVGGGGTVGTVSLNGPAPVGGAVVLLSGNNAAVAQVPSTVTVTPNATTATFSATTSSVTTSTTVAVSGTYNGTATANLTVVPQSTVSSLSLSPASVAGGNSSTGTVTLSSPAPGGGLAVALTSSNAGVVQVPATVTVPANATTATFTATTVAVAVQTTATITASVNGSTRTATLTVNQPTLSSARVSPSSLVGGNSSTGTVTLSSAAPAGGIAVVLSSSNTSAAKTPATVTVAAGGTSANFTVSTMPVSTSTNVTISAILGSTTRTATLVVNSPALSSVTLNPTSVVGGTSSTGTVTLTGVAAANVVVTLSSNRSSVVVQSTVTIPTGASQAPFVITTTPVSTSTSATISATNAGVTRNATLTVSAPSLSLLGLSPTTIKGGASATGTVTLNGPAPTGGMSVSLSSSRTNVATVPGSITIASGSTTGTFSVTTSRVSTQTSVTISGSRNGTRSATLTVTP